MIAATGSGSGKTTVTSALLNVLKDRDVNAFKCGPDYIDPMFHREVIGIQSTNLDCFFCNREQLNDVFNRNAGTVNIIEAAMGIYDGIGTGMKASAYEVAAYLSCPIILLVDGHGMGYSLVALINGFLSMDKNSLIKGVILNRVSEKYYKKIAPVIEQETGVKMLGFLPKIKGAELSSRHLGLMSPKENDFKNKLEIISEQVKLSIDIEKIISIGQYEDDSLNNTEDKSHDKPNSKRKIAVARDEAFTFIYDENINVLKSAGVEIEFFSPVHDTGIPEDCDCLIFYGGYPENYTFELSSNTSMLDSIRKASENGVKIIAECGGFMYLLNSIFVNGTEYKMAGLIDGSAKRTDGLVRFGYVNVIHDGQIIKGHEFHHFEAEEICYSNDYDVENVSSKNRYSGIVKTDNIFAGFPHLYYLSNPEFIFSLINDKQAAN